MLIYLLHSSNSKNKLFNTKYDFKLRVVIKSQNTYLQILIYVMNCSQNEPIKIFNFSQNLITYFYAKKSNNF